ncbi:YgdB family protein [Budviciaceae bacterium BWR-B9]|uniref:YgdB family protein n=2 Tax=Limnobaculum allomyrinae TaxID=2791986 RepID=A0ABS1ISI1_9GAMM|nr:YgdB family protein [Limnobaculum sp. M2-1]MBK5144604.1 YgdB family protein [Limnobaculum allomyrinae]
MFNQQGYSTIVMVMLLMLFGSLMLKGQSEQLLVQVKIYADERRYFRAYHQALSSLSWALSQRWAGLSSEWQCRKIENHHLSSCIRQLNDDGDILVRGEGTMGNNQPPLVLFQLAGRFDTLPFSEGIRLQPFPYRRIDFCPLKAPAECSP